MARAKATRHGVVASGLTTDRSQTTANPDGTFTVRSSLMPVRAFRGGKWQNLDATLHQAGKSVTPAVSESPLSLSAGGSGPLAVMTALGRTLSLYWPSVLPAPVISGATATYRNVLPGVDLAVTADSLGGISETLIIRTPVAAANPALAAIRLRAVASPGLHLATDAAGDLAVTAGGDAQPAFTAQEPLMWDSPPAPAGLATVTNSAGVVVGAGSGMPADSSAAAPGASAQVTQVPLSVSGDTITLSPPAAALSVPAADFPLYIDPSFHDAAGASAANWTQVDSGYPTTTYWDEGSDLQVGDCGWPGCANVQVARSFFTMPVPGGLAGATIGSAYLYMTDAWSATCSNEPVNFGITGAIGSGTDWNNQPGWWNGYQTQSFNYGCNGTYTGNNLTWGITADAQAAINNGWPTITFGMQAGNEGDPNGWKQFLSGASNLTMSISYSFAPNQPANPVADGGCGTAASPNVIGNDDVTFSATASDKDGDPSLTTTFTVVNSGTGSTHTFAVTTGENTAAIGTESAATMASSGWGAGVYSWSAVTADENSAQGPPSATCYFNWNPNRPAAPSVSACIPGSCPGTGVSVSQTIGQPVTITIKPPASCGSTTNPCPTSYTYQLGPQAPSTVTVGSGSCTTTSCPVTVTVSQLGPITVGVSGVANGNPGQINDSQVVTGEAPTTPYADGYFSGGTYPDVLTIGTAKSDPSLWLSRGTGNGTVGAAVDIGSLGTGIPPSGATGDGPADWASAQVLHGNFTGSGVQDVIAYYPTGANAGNGSVIPGSGDAYTLNSAAGNDIALGGSLNDEQFANTSDVPMRLVAAGNASEQGVGLDDLIGILGDSTNGYELNLYTTTPFLPGNYNLDTTLSLASAGGPDGDPWNDFQLATAQPGGNASAVVLFALDTTKGQLWESENPGCPATSPTATCSTTTLAGMAGTWTKLTGTLPSALTSADINQKGAIELWRASGNVLTAYAVSGTTVSLEGSSALTHPGHDWPLTDGAVNGAGNCNATTPATAVDTITGSSATVKGAFNWSCDDTLGADLTLTAPGSYLTPAPATIPATADAPSLSLWFKTSTADGVLASLQQQAVSAGPSSSYNPVLYIGSDGRLNAEWWNGAASPIVSASPVDDGLWHHAVLTTTSTGGTTTQTLTLDGKVQGTVTGNVDLTWASTTNLTFGAGYLGSSWPDQPHYGQSPAVADYYTGQLAAITLSAAASTVTVTSPGNQTGAVGTPESVQISAADSTSGQTLAYTATGLPAGLTINSSSGLISGTPTATATSAVTVTAFDSAGAYGSASFSWTIGACTGFQWQATAVFTANMAFTNCRGTLVMQADGNFVLYNENWTAIWATNTSGNPGAQVDFQTDGNLVVYNASDVAIWASNTYEKAPGGFFCYQADGNLVIYNSAWQAVWASNTVHS